MTSANAKEIRTMPISHASLSSRIREGETNDCFENNAMEEYVHDQEIGSEQGASTKMEALDDDEVFDNRIHCIPDDAHEENDDDNDNAAVQQLAARLAPVLEATDAFLQNQAVPEEFRVGQSSSSLHHPHLIHGDHFDKDDGLDDELEALRLSEDLMRQEMELAQDFSLLFGRSFPSAFGDHSYDYKDDFDQSHVHHGTNEVLLGSTDDSAEFSQCPFPLVIMDEEDDDQGHNHVHTSSQGNLPPIRIPTPPAAKQTIALHSIHHGDSFSPSPPSASAPQVTNSVATFAETLRDHSGVPLASPSTAARTSSWTSPWKFVTTANHTTSSPQQQQSILSLAHPEDETAIWMDETLHSPKERPSPISSESSSHPVSPQSQSSVYTNRDHFNYLRMHRPIRGGWYTTDLTPLMLQPTATPQQLFPELPPDVSSIAMHQFSTGTKTNNLGPINDKVAYLASEQHRGILKRVDESQTPGPKTIVGDPNEFVATVTTPSTMDSTLMSQMSYATTSSLSEKVVSFFPFHGIHEYCVTLPDAKLRQLFEGVLDDDTTSTTRTTTSSSSPLNTQSSDIEINIPRTLRKEGVKAQSRVAVAPPRRLLLPVRTLVLRIRPDVLCGAVMDAVQTSLEYRFRHDDTHSWARIQKRQGSHLRALVKGAVFDPQYSAQSSSNLLHGSDNQSGWNDQATLDSANNAVASLPFENFPPFILDAQLCTYKSVECERVLLIRVYNYIPSKNDKIVGSNDDPHSTVDDDGEDEISDNDEQIHTVGLRESPEDGRNDGYGWLSHEKLESPIDTAPTFYLRECCALMQRMETAGTAKKIRLHSRGKGPATDETLSTKNGIQMAVSTHLLHEYRACPSVQNGHLTAPALNSRDWRVLLSSWRAIPAIWQELETRELTFSSLSVAKFGSFPSLPTLDVQYCSQLRRVSREMMLVQLLKNASELEAYARDAEIACANMVAMLLPTFEKYGIEAPSMPQPTPLTDYPLNFSASQTICPPWGVKVMNALNEVQAWVSDAQSSLAWSVNPTPLTVEESNKSFQLASRAVNHIFHAFQTQDDDEKSARLERKNLQVMDRLATMQAHQFSTIYALHNSSRLSDVSARAADEVFAKSQIREVPLVKWSVVMGSVTSGTCWVTANHIIIVAQLIPIVGGTRTAVFALAEVDFEMSEAAPSVVLGGRTVTIVIRRHGQVVYSFRPSTGGARLKSLLDVIRSAARQPPLDLSA